MSDDEDLIDRLVQLNRMMETASLLPDRQYIILNEVDEDNVSLSIYDTTGENAEHPTASTIIMYGILEMMENRMEELVELGMFRASTIDDNEKPAKITGASFGDNVVKVDFGKKH